MPELNYYFPFFASYRKEKKKLIIKFGVVVPGCILITIMIGSMIYFCWKSAQNNAKAARYRSFTEREEVIVLRPTYDKPDLAKIRIINEDELRKGDIIGSGAFGSVYKVRFILFLVTILQSTLV